MSELQLGLLGLGTLAVLGVVAYNKWQEHRHRKLAEQVLQRGHTDVLLGSAHHAGHAAEPAAAGDHDAPRATGPAFDPDAIDVLAPAARPLNSARSDAAERIEPVFSLPPEADEADEAVAAAETPATTSSEPVPASDALARIAAGDAASVATPAQPVPHAVAAAVPPLAPVGSPLPAAGPGVDDAAGDDAEVPPIIVSPAIDYIASFDLVEPVYGDQILRSQHELLTRLSKPVSWAGYNDRTREWERVSDTGNYRRLRVGLLLADRRGPLGEADLLTFRGAMQNLAEELMAIAELPSHDAALDAAIALDQFCANVDVQIGINVVSQGQVFPGTKIRALAEAAGMVLDSSGRFVRCDDDGNVLYTLANQESAGFVAESMKHMSTHGLVFILDVPCVSHGDRVFAQMLDLARRMAETLHGVLVDDNRQPLSESMLDPFRRQIGQYQSQLAARGLQAGSPLTRRLFS